MKRTNRILSMILGVAIIFGASSCKEDEPDIPSGGDGIAVADGFYITQEGVEPLSTSQLKSALVDAEGFSAMAREGFVQGYVYLTTGSYNVVEIVSKAIVNTYGGTLINVSGDAVHNKECDADNSAYSLVGAVADGSAFSVSTEGLYVVAYDATTNEIVFDQIETAGIIGAATPGGWSNDTGLTTSSTIAADGATWTLEGVTIDVGEMKFRYNCRWAIDRRIDNTQPFDNANGYSFFTNYGGTLDNLLAGNEGANIQMTEYAVYTVVFNWAPGTGVSATVTKTGEAEPKAEYSETMFMVGDGLNGWGLETGEGIAMNPVHSNPHLFWGIAWVQATGGFKFAPEELWAGDFGKSGDATDGVYAKGGDNIPVPGTAGYYMIVVNLDPAAETIEINKPLIYGIGDAFGSWDAAGNLFTEDLANEVMTSPAFTADATMRMYTSATTFTPVGDGPAVDWWQAEFTVLEGKIEYRTTGGDQAAAPVTAGQTVSLKFADGTGSVQ